MKNKITKEVKTLIKKLNLDCSVNKFKDEVNWKYISSSQTLSEDFIREFKDEVDWYNISYYQTLSEFGEDFIREFKDKVNWYNISSSQNLSNSSKFSKKFMEEFKSKIDIKLQKETHAKKTLKQKIKEVKAYPKKHDLKYDEDYLYAFRDHDKNGSGVYNKAIKYKKGKYYKDWHCDMKKNEENSFGLGIWPKGNTNVKIKINDWGVAVNKSGGKARVMGFEII